MLRYLAYGARRYGSRPVHPSARERWELEGALSGRIAPVIPGGPRLEPRERRLWLLPPHHGHGWTGDGSEATVAVLSPLKVPLAIEYAAMRAACQGGLLHWDMSRDDAAWLAREIEALIPRYAQPDAVDLLRQERLVLSVCIRVLDAQPPGLVQALDDDPQRQIDAAMTWFAHHLGEGVGALEMARALHISPAHLRRLFHRVLGAPPRAVFDRFRLQHADQMLVSTTLPLDEIAAACGFSSASTFCRAYQRSRGRTPGRTRAIGPTLNNPPRTTAR
jgi:AraC family transcriptional regulator